ncbi:hypothetical protein [Streptomyces sp. NPDC049585]|uniref:hypothetical protein n=1 Tax=Streptomyces sp. NPDC049585 TaxID=3155154 RepID=UPI00341AF8F8
MVRRTNKGHRRRWAVRGGCGLAAVVLLSGAALPARAAAPDQHGVVQVDLGLDGAQPNGWSEASGMSADGRYALFVSLASNLVPGDTDLNYDAFVRDLRTGRIERVSLGDDGSPLGAGEAAISGDGRSVAFSSVVPGSNSWQIFVRDRRSGHTRQVTTGAEDFESPTISWNGRYVAYASRQGSGIYVTDRWKGTTRLITTAPDGSPADRGCDNPVISADGSTIGFRSTATNLVPPAQAPTVTGARPPRPRRTPQFYVWNAHTGRIQRASIDAAGAPREALLGASLSPDGRYALFRTPEPNGNGTDPNASHDELYVRDLWRGTTTAAGRPLPGTRTVGGSYGGTMTADSRWVVFASDADNLVPGDTNQATDIFRRDMWTGRTERIDMAGISWTPVSLLVNSLGTTALFNETGKVYSRRLPTG